MFIYVGGTLSVCIYMLVGLLVFRYVGGTLSVCICWWDP